MGLGEKGKQQLARRLEKRGCIGWDPASISEAEGEGGVNYTRGARGGASANTVVENAIYNSNAKSWRHRNARVHWAQGADCYPLTLYPPCQSRVLSLTTSEKSSRLSMARFTKAKAVASALSAAHKSTSQPILSYRESEACSV